MVAGLLGSGLVLLGFGSSSGAASNPPANVPEDLPTANYCRSLPDNGAACTAAELHDVNVARQSLGLAAMVLPADFATLPPPEQELIVTNAERQPYGLAPFPSLDTRLNAAAAAVDPAGPLADPLLPGDYLATQWQSIVAAGSPNVLGADYQWMYNDGPGGTNRDCTPTTPSGCWDHRQAILTDDSPTQTMGAGTGTLTGAPVFAELFVANAESGGPPASVAQYGCASPQAGDLFWCPGFAASSRPPEVLSLSRTGSSFTTPLTISGNYFAYDALGDPAARVLFGGRPGRIVGLQGDGSLTVVPPTDPFGGAFATVPITMTYRTPTGWSTGAPACLVPGGQSCTYTYLGPPVVTGVRPLAASTRGGTRLFLRGHGLDSPGVRICLGHRCLRPTRQTVSSAVVVAPASTTPGPVTVTARNRFGQSLDAPVHLSYVLPFPPAVVDRVERTSRL